MSIPNFPVRAEITYYDEKVVGIIQGDRIGIEKLAERNKELVRR